MAVGPAPGGTALTSRRVIAMLVKDLMTTPAVTMLGETPVAEV
jgi:hypothetical protein